MLAAPTLVTALVFVAHVCGRAIAAINTARLAILLIVALPVVATATSFSLTIVRAGLVVMRLLVAASSALLIVAALTAAATALPHLIIRVALVVPLLLIALLASATAATTTSLRLLRLVLVLVILVVFALVHALMVEVLIVAVVLLAVHPIVLVSTPSAAAASPTPLTAAIAAVAFDLLLVPILFVWCTAPLLVLLAVRWIGNALVDALLLVGAISPTLTMVPVIVFLLLTLALYVAALSFIVVFVRRCNAVGFLKRAAGELDHFKAFRRLVGDHAMRG